jgi:hypothetical protein
MNIIWTDLANGESALTFRQKINTVVKAIIAYAIPSTEVSYSGNLTGATVGVALDDAGTRIEDLETATATLQDILENPSVCSNATATPKAPQVLVPNVAEKLDRATVNLVDSGTAISCSTANDNFTINEDGVYKFGGTITFLAPINDLIEIELRLNSNSTGFKTSLIGRGDEPVTAVYYSMSNFNETDVLDIWVTSTGSEVTIQNSNVIVEKTVF